LQETKEETMMTAEQYIRSLESVLAPHFAPGEIYHGEEGAMRLAREVGYGLRGLEGAAGIVQALYTRLLVRFTLHGSGVPVSAGPWFAEMRRAMGEA
jgi:hypothetical protein